LSQLNNHFGKIGIAIVVIGLLILYIDGYKMSQDFSASMTISDHPEIYIPILGIIITSIGAVVFIINYTRGRIVI